MNHRSLTLLAGLAISIAGGLLAGAGTASADEVVPGLTCDAISEVISCNNTTDKDYTVLQKKECAAGSWTTTDFYYVYGPNGSATMTPHMNFHSIEASVEFATVFVPAHNGALGLNGCDYDVASISYSIAPPAPPAPSEPSN